MVATVLARVPLKKTFSTQWNKNILSVLCCTAEKFSWIICCHFPPLMSFAVRVKALRKADILYILYCPHTDGWLLPTYIMVFFMFCCLFCPNDECKGRNKTWIHYAIKNVAENIVQNPEKSMCCVFVFHSWQRWQQSMERWCWWKKKKKKSVQLRSGP